MAPVTRDNERPLRILVTGFGPFGKAQVNPSYHAIKNLPKSDLLPAALRDASPGRAVELTCIEVPVVYDSVLSMIPPRHGLSSTKEAINGHKEGEDSYDIYLHLGQGLSGHYAIEAQAHRFEYAGRIDVDGKQPPIDERVDAAGLAGSEWDRPGVDVVAGETLQGCYDASKLATWLSEKSGLKVLRSDDPGHYCCDFIYYTSMSCAIRAAAGSRSPTPVLFVHVPPVGSPYTLEQTTEMVKLIIYALANLDFALLPKDASVPQLTDQHTVGR